MVTPVVDLEEARTIAAAVVYEGPKEVHKWSLAKAINREAPQRGARRP